MLDNTKTSKGREPQYLAKIIFLILVIVAVSLFIFNIKNKENDQTNETKVEVIEVDDYQKELGLFETVLKLAWYSLAIGDYDGINGRLEEVDLRWRIIEENFSQTQPNGYGQTANWPGFIAGVSGGLKKAKEQATEKKLDLAQKEISTIFKLIDKVKSENGRVCDYQELLDFYAVLVKVTSADSKEAVQVYLPELKIAYTFLKGKILQGESVGIIAKMENEIGVLDKSFYGPDFQKAQTDLQQDFFDLFLSY